jgi:hypothetical protein
MIRIQRLVVVSLACLGAGALSLPAADACGDTPARLVASELTAPGELPSVGPPPAGRCVGCIEPGFYRHVKPRRVYRESPLKWKTDRQQRRAGSKRADGKTTGSRGGTYEQPANPGEPRTTP